MQTATEATEQARRTLQRLGPFYEMDPNLLTEAEERELFEAVAFLERDKKIGETELTLRIRRQKRG